MLRADSPESESFAKTSILPLALKELIREAMFLTDHIIEIISTILVEEHLRNKTNILTKFQLAQSKNAASVVLTIFSFNLA